MARDMTPADLDPVDSAAAPITPDPRLQPTSRAAMIQRLMAAGMTQAEAERAVDAQLGISGPRPQTLFDEDNTPAGNDALRGRIADMRRREDGQAAFERNYNEATGAPAPATLAAQPAPVSPGQQLRTPDELRDMGYNPYTEPGPRMPDGRPMKQPRALTNRDEAVAYNARPEMMPATEPSGPGQSARYSPSLRDRAWMARGFVPVFNADGGVSYQLSPDTGVEGMPGASGRGGRRADLEAPLMKADGTVYKDENGNPVPKWVVADAQSPTGTIGMGEGSATVAVYAPSGATRDVNAAYRAERRLYEQAAQAGVPPAQFLKDHPDSFPDLTADGIRRDPGARMAVQAGRQADADARMKAWRSQMRLSGGQATGGPGGTKAAINAYGQLNDPNTNDWQRAVMAARLAPNLQGTTPLGVEANSAANAMRLLNADMFAEGLGGFGDAKRLMLEQKNRNDAVARAEVLMAKYPRGSWDGMYDAKDVETVRNAVEQQYPGHGDAAVAQFRVRPPKSKPAPGPRTPTGSSGPVLPEDAPGIPAGDSYG